MGTTTAYAGNTGNSTTRTPRLGRRLMSSLLADGVRLTLVFGQTLCGVLIALSVENMTLIVRTVNLLHDIETDGRGENGRERERGRCLPGYGANVDGRAGGHCLSYLRNAVWSSWCVSTDGTRVVLYSQFPRQQTRPRDVDLLQ